MRSNAPRAIRVLRGGGARVEPSRRPRQPQPLSAGGARGRAAVPPARVSARVDYPATHLPVLVSRDGHETLVLAAFATRGRLIRSGRAHTPTACRRGVRFGGNDVAFNEINKRTSSDLARAEMFALPILLLLSFWVFRGLVAAALPLLVGGFAIVITFLLLRLVNQFAGTVDLRGQPRHRHGAGSRHRLQPVHPVPLSRGAGPRPGLRAAIERTLQTAGRTVLYGSLTVAGALACLLVFPLRFLYSMGVGGVLVTLSAGAVSLVVLPAVLVALGPRINALAPARLQRSAAQAAQPAESGGWYRLAHAVMRRPGARRARARPWS